MKKDSHFVFERERERKSQADNNNACVTEQSLSRRRRATFFIFYFFIFYFFRFIFFFIFSDNESLGVHSSVTSWLLECGYFTFWGFLVLDFYIFRSKKEGLTTISLSRNFFLSHRSLKFCKFRIISNCWKF